MNDQQISLLIGLCSQWWPNWRSPESLPTMVVSWRQLLGDVDFDAGLAAISEHATSGEHFPPPVGVIRRRAIELAMPGGSAPTVDEAWLEVRKEIARVGCFVPSVGEPERVATFSHPSITAVVNSMTWLSLCTSTNEVADRAHFARMYAERVRRDVDRAAEPQAVQAVRSAALNAGGEPRSIGESIGELVQRP